MQKVIQYLIIVFSICLLTAFQTDKIDDSPMESLVLISAKPVNDMPLGNLSGITFCQNKWLVVSDKDDEYIYHLTEKDFYYQAKKMALPAMPGLNNLSELSILEKKQLLNSQDNLDFEGIFCDKEGSVYLVSELTSQVLRITPDFCQSNWLKLSENWLNEAKRVNFLTVPNAKLEGITLDPGGQKIWMAAERENRGIIFLEKISGQWICRDCVLLSEDVMGVSPKLLGSKELPLDFSDIFYYQGKLFTLERLQHQICRRDSRSARVEKCWRFENSVLQNENYQYAQYSFGQAEALWLNKNEVWIGLDNNNMRRNDGEDRPIIYRFKAPKKGWLN
ncbi:DNA topoisomerase IV [Neisseriaceae bacterium PsAf]|nr:DNA topoisomerase IV [Neisseriaceae bacterium PsAf]